MPRWTTSRGVMKSSAASFTSAPNLRIRCSYTLDMVRSGIASGLQVDGGEVLADLVENTLLVHLADRVDKIELLEDHAGIARELRDVVLKVLPGAARPKCFKAIARGIVERVAGGLTQDDIDIEPIFNSHLVHLGGFSPSGLKDAFQTAEKGKRQDDLAEIDVFEVAPEVICVLPNEVGK